MNLTPLIEANDRMFALSDFMIQLEEVERIISAQGHRKLPINCRAVEAHLANGAEFTLSYTKPMVEALTASTCSLGENMSLRVCVRTQRRGDPVSISWVHLVDENIHP